MRCSGTYRVFGPPCNQTPHERAQLHNQCSSSKPVLPKRIPKSVDYRYRRASSHSKLGLQRDSIDIKSAGIEHHLQSLWRYWHAAPASEFPANDEDSLELRAGISDACPRFKNALPWSNRPQSLPNFVSRNDRGALPTLRDWANMQTGALKVYVFRLDRS